MERDKVSATLITLAVVCAGCDTNDVPGRSSPVTVHLPPPAPYNPQPGFSVGSELLNF